MEKGTVKWFDPAKGFGFISRADGPDVFLPYTAIQGNVNLLQGDSVEFVIVDGPKGPQAAAVIAPHPHDA